MKTTYLYLVLFFLGLNHINAQEQSEISTKDTLIVGYNINAPFIYKKNDKLDGITYKMWEGITKEDNTHYILEYHPLDSLLLGLTRGSIDIGLSPLTINHDRSNRIDFSIPYYVTNSTGLVKKLTAKQKFFEFLRSFSILRFINIIGYLLVLLSVFGFLVWVFERKKNEEFGEGIKGFWNGLWWSAVTMTTVGYGDKSPKTVGGRVIGLIWMFAAIILISSITAGITSSLTVEKLEWNANDFSYFKDIKIGTVKNSVTEQKLLNHYSHNLISYNTFDELMQGLKKDEVKGVSYDEPLLRFVLNNNDDFKDYELLNFKFNQSFYAVGFSKKLNEKKKDEISKKILKFTESNDWKILLSKYDLISKQNLILDIN